MKDLVEVLNIFVNTISPYLDPTHKYPTMHLQPLIMDLLAHFVKPLTPNEGPSDKISSDSKKEKEDGEVVRSASNGSRSPILSTNEDSLNITRFQTQDGKWYRFNRRDVLGR